MRLRVDVSDRTVVAASRASVNLSERGAQDVADHRRARRQVGRVEKASVEIPAQGAHVRVFVRLGDVVVIGDLRRPNHVQGIKCTTVKF